MTSLRAGEKTIPIAITQLEQLATKYGTPYQLYDEGAIRRNARNLIDNFRKAFPKFQQHFYQSQLYLYRFYQLDQ